MAIQSGFISLIGKPNAGKSTLFNAMMKLKLASVTHKAQTTRHRLRGILSGKKFQVVLCDTPGVISTRNKLHSAMMRQVEEALVDSDLLLVVLDLSAPWKEAEEVLLLTSPVYPKCCFVLNKAEKKPEHLADWQSRIKSITGREGLPLSAGSGLNVEKLLGILVGQLPVQPPFFDEEMITDRSERFFISEIIREKILILYRDEIPYSVEVLISEYKEEKTITRIRVQIITERESQKRILIGKGGSAIKKLGIESRQAIEKFLEKKTFLELTVKVNANWRNDDKLLKYFGYNR